VFFRDDILKKMQRHALFPPSDPDMEVTEHVSQIHMNTSHQTQGKTRRIS